MKHFTLIVVLISIACIFWGDDVLGFSLRMDRVMQGKKLGMCPKPTGSGECFELCSGDNDCPGDFKCCFDGCGRFCMSPV